MPDFRILKIPNFWLDHLILILGSFLAFTVSLIFNANVFISTLLFFGIPSIYLTIRLKGNISNFILFSFLISVPMSLIFDYLGLINEQWFVSYSAFDWKIMGMISMEMMIWGFLSVYTYSLYFGYFYLKKYRIKLNWKFLLLFLLGAFVVIMRYYHSTILNFSYAYLKLGTLFVLIPFVILSIKLKQHFFIVLKVIPYALLLNILFEVSALLLDQWHYPGEYLKMIHISSLIFPVEEIIFWIILVAPTLALCLLDTRSVKR